MNGAMVDQQRSHHVPVIYLCLSRLSVGLWLSMVGQRDMAPALVHQATKIGQGDGYKSGLTTRLFPRVPSPKRAMERGFARSFCSSRLVLRFLDDVKGFFPQTTYTFTIEPQLGEPDKRRQRRTVRQHRPLSQNSQLTDWHSAILQSPRPSLKHQTLPTPLLDVLETISSNRSRKGPIAVHVLGRHGLNGCLGAMVLCPAFCEDGHAQDLPHMLTFGAL